MTDLHIWAPSAQKVEVEIDARRVPLEAMEGGWWYLETDALRHGTDYRLWVDDTGPWPDPRSAHQPQGIEPVSRWVDHGTTPCGGRRCCATR